MLVTIPEAAEDDASALLWDLGTLGVEVRAASGGATTLLAYFPAEAGLLARVGLGIASIAGARVEASAVPDVDWVERFRENFRGFDVGSFRIAPPWDRPERIEPGQHLILMDPGRAFGTGTHETTRLCLRALEQLFAERSVASLLDVGTGTGILAIAALQLGAGAATGVENDPEALDNAREHAALNGVAPQLVLGDGARGLEARAYDMVVANITAPLLRERAAEILATARPGGRVILSGLLADEADAVAAAYAHAGPITKSLDGEWACLVVRVRP